MEWEKRKSYLTEAGKPLIALQEKGICSFCNSIEKPNLAVFRSNITGKCICMRCYYVSLISTEIIPEGAICCLKCNKYSSVICKYTSKSKVLYSFAGLDSQKRVIYTVTNTTGKWSFNDPIIEVSCGLCGYPIPFWMLEFSSYVKSSYSK